MEKFQFVLVFNDKVDALLGQVSFENIELTVANRDFSHYIQEGYIQKEVSAAETPNLDGNPERQRQ